MCLAWDGADLRLAHREKARAMNHPETPFPRHWLYYIALKVVVIAAAVAVALKFLGYW
jgi:hypothetical protein